jgi:hypothetical protein
MPAPGTRSPLVLGVLGVLTAGAIALSLATAPPVAEQQLNIGASATPGSGSFLMEVTNTLTTTVAGRAPVVQHSSEFVVYQAPDRFHYTTTVTGGRRVEVICVGTVGFERTAGGHWVKLQPGLGGSTCPGPLLRLALVPSAVAAGGTPVVRHGQTSNATYTYAMPPAYLAAVAEVLFQVPPSALGHPLASATIDKEYMVSQRFRASHLDQTDAIEIRYSQVGTAPAISAPSA